MNSKSFLFSCLGNVPNKKNSEMGTQLYGASSGELKENEPDCGNQSKSESLTTEWCGSESMVTQALNQARGETSTV